MVTLFEKKWGFLNAILIAISRNPFILKKKQNDFEINYIFGLKRKKNPQGNFNKIKPF